MPQSSITLSLPTVPKLLTMPLQLNSPPAQGRRLPNKGWLVSQDEHADVIYKFNHWEKAQLSFNEISIYALLAQQQEPFPAWVGMPALSVANEHIIQVLEHAKGGSLDQYLMRQARAGVTPDCSQYTYHLLLQIALGMQQLHARDIVHRDLKAENVLVCDTLAHTQTHRAPRVKIADFDRSAYLAQHSYFHTTVGSLFHQAPELLLEQAYMHAVDVYAFGILIYEISHRARAYSNVATGLPGSIDKQTFITQVTHDSRRPVWQHPDPKLHQLAQQCWAHSPDARPDFAHIVQTLTSLCAAPEQQLVSKTPTTMAQVSPNMGIARTQGKVRQSMEDCATLISHEGMHIAAVFDGLLGARSSEYAAWYLPLYLTHQLNTHPSTPISELIQDAFSSTQARLRRMDPPIQCGTTATVVIVDDTHMHIAWAGDSPAWLFRRHACAPYYTAIPLVLAHHPDEPMEALRLMQQGAYIGRENKILDSGEEVPWGPVRVFLDETKPHNGIALSRALGVLQYAQVLTHNAEIVQLARHTDDLFLVLGSDGIAETLTSKDYYALHQNTHTPQETAQAIIHAVVEGGAPDNATAIVIDLQARP